MNEPHDLNRTVDHSSAPADSLDAGLAAGFAAPCSGPGAQLPGPLQEAAGDSARATAAADALPEAPPGYRVLHEIARGGMGRVLAAHDLTLDRDVALKVLLGGASSERFVRESKITARLPHPGIPPVHALGTLPDGSPFLAMKLVAGRTLAEEMKSADRPRLLQAFVQVCQAAGFAHSKGIIHRDLKPANVMVGAFGEVQVMDWGLAKDLTSPEVEQVRSAQKPEPLAGTDPNQTTDERAADESTDARTQAGAVMGTPAYMAPEQARGEVCDARADVFALGGILCALLTGKPPFSGKSSLEAIRRAAAADLGEAHTRLDGCGADAELVALCRNCLSSSPADRPKDGQAVAGALTTYLGGVQKRLQSAHRERAVAEAREIEQRKRRRVKIALAAAVVALLLGGGAFAWWQDRQGTEARNREQLANQGVDAALKLVPDLRKQYKFEAAKKTLDQAAVLAKGAAPDRLAEVKQAQRDLKLVVELDGIRYRKWVWISVAGGSRGHFNEKIAPPEYRRAFKERGLDLASLGPAEAAQRIAASAVKAELVAAVDDWALVEPKPRVRNRLLEIARRADPGSWTDRLRDPAVRTDRAAVQKLAADADAAGTPAATLSILADLVERLGLNPAPLLTAARADHPADFELAFKLGQWHLRHGNNDQYLGPYEAARALRPDNLAVCIQLGLALTGKGRLDEAIAIYRRALAIDPQFSYALNNLGLALQGKGQVDEAIGCFRQMIARYPKWVEPHFNLGNALLRKGQLEEAMKCYRKAIALDPKDAEAHNGLGDALFAKKDLVGAEAAIRKAIALDPKLAPAHSNLGKTLHEQGKVEEAIASHRKAIAIDPKLALAYHNLGTTLSRKGQLDEAIACYRKAIALAPGLAQPHNGLGISLYLKGQLDEAIACFKKAIELDPKYADARKGLGVALLRKGLFDEAIASFKKAIELDPMNAGAHTGLGDALKAKGKVDEAIACYKKAIALDPKNAKAHSRLGSALGHKGQVDEAIACYRKAIALDPKDAKTHTNLGAIFCDVKRDYDAAITRFRKAIAIDPKLAWAHYCLGNALKGKGRLDEAITSYRKAIALDPKDAQAHINLGVALDGKGKVEEAITCYREAIALDPKHAKAHHNLGAMLCDVKRDYDAAIACFRKAIALDPKYAQAHNNLGNALGKKGQLDEAITCYREAVALDPKYAAAHTNLGAILCNVKRDYDGAIASFRKVVEITPKSASAHYNLGVAWHFKGKPDEAAACFRQAVALDPKFPGGHLGVGVALQGQGKAKEAVASLRKAIALDPNLDEARAELTKAERLAAVQDKLSAFLKGDFKPTTNDERLGLASWCKIKKRYRTSAGLCTAAFAADPKLADDLEAEHRYTAARSAVLAAAGKGEDAAKLDDKERALLRKQALDWLRADLAGWSKRMQSGSRIARRLVTEHLQPWLVSSDLASIRDKAALAKLPAEERAACEKLWADVAALLKKAQTPTQKEGK